MLSQLSRLLDDLHTTQTPLLVGATSNDVSRLDGSLRRPGRLTHEIFIPVPSVGERQLMVEALLPSSGPQDQAQVVAQATPGYVATDLAALCLRLSPEKRQESGGDTPSAAASLKVPSIYMNQLLLCSSPDLQRRISDNFH